MYKGLGKKGNKREYESLLKIQIRYPLDNLCKNPQHGFAVICFIIPAADNPIFSRRENRTMSSTLNAKAQE